MAINAFKNSFCNDFPNITNFGRTARFSASFTFCVQNEFATLHSSKVRDTITRQRGGNRRDGGGVEIIKCRNSIGFHFVESNRNLVNSAVLFGILLKHIALN